MQGPSKGFSWIGPVYSLKSSMDHNAGYTRDLPGVRKSTCADSVAAVHPYNVHDFNLEMRGTECRRPSMCSTWGPLDVAWRGKDGALGRIQEECMHACARDCWPGSLVCEFMRYPFTSCWTSADLFPSRWREVGS